MHATSTHDASLFPFLLNAQCWLHLYWKGMQLLNDYLLLLINEHTQHIFIMPGSTVRTWLRLSAKLKTGIYIDIFPTYGRSANIQWMYHVGSLPPPSVDPRKTCDMLCRTYQGKHVLDVCFSNADKLCSRSRRFLAGYRYLSVMWVLCQYSMNRRWYSAYHAVVSYCMNMYNRIFFSHRIRMRFNVFWSGHESAHVYTGRTRPRPGHRAGPLRVRLS